MRFCARGGLGVRAFASIGRGDVAGGSGGLGGREPVRLAGDDHCATEQRKAERLDRPTFDFERFGGVRQEAADLTGFGLEGGRQIGDRHDGGSDPGRDDQETQSDDCPAAPGPLSPPREGREFFCDTDLSYPVDVRCKRQGGEMPNPFLLPRPG
jgi:hypothetical protein